MWQYGLVDMFTELRFIYNAGTQYSAVVIASLASGNAIKLPSMLFEPIAGLRVSYRFVKAAQTVVKKRSRVATLAILLSASATTATTSNAATNTSLGEL